MVLVSLFWNSIKALWFNITRNNLPIFRLLCKGTKHQGDLDGGGRQCVCVALCFMANTTPQTSSDVDHILQLGTDLYHSVCFHNNYMLVDDILATVNIEDRTLSLDIKDPRGGVVSQRVDDLKALTFSVALKLCFDESSTCFLTVGHYPSYTIGLKKGNNEN